MSGRVKEPGVKFAPAGISVRELIDEFCGGMKEGHAFKAYLPGGAGRHPAARLGDLPLDFGTLEAYGCFIGSAAVVVFSDQDDLRAVALNLMRFFEDESCGQCTPCRVGTEKAVALMNEPDWDESLLSALSTVMRDASICGLGQAAPTVAVGAALLSGGNPMSRPSERIEFTLNGSTVAAAPGETIWQVAHREGSRSRICATVPSPATVPTATAAPAWSRFAGERVLAAVVPAQADRGDAGPRRHRIGRRSSPRAWCSNCCSPTSPLEGGSARPDPRSGNGPSRRRYVEPVSRACTRAPAPDPRHPAMAVNWTLASNAACACACREVQVNDVIGMAARGHRAKDRFRSRRPDGDEYLRRLRRVRPGVPDRRAVASSSSTPSATSRAKPDRTVDSLCPYCGVGCQLTYQIDDDRILSVVGRDGPANHNRLCVKGRFGYDYVPIRNASREPLIRRADVPKGADVVVDPADPSSHFRVASWKEALDCAAAGLRRVRYEFGGHGLAGSARRKAQMKRRIFFRSSCAPGSASTTSTIAHDYVMPPRSPR